jgi:hypothetical protein
MNDLPPTIRVDLMRTLARNSIPENAGPSLYDPSAPTTRCSDFFTVRSLDTSVEVRSQSVPSGVPIEFVVTLQNTDVVPVVQANVQAKLFRAPTAATGGGSDASANSLVDQFMVFRDVSLKAGEQMERTTTFQLPANLPSGLYTLSTYTTAGESSDTDGVPYINNPTRAQTGFTVIGEFDNAPYLMSDRVFVDGTQYLPNSRPPAVSATDPVNVSMSLVNPTQAAIDVPVVWSLYKNDSWEADNLIAQSTSTVSVASGDRVTANHTITDTEHAVYTLVAKTMHNEVASYATVRMARAGKENQQIDRAAVLSYPLTADTASSMYACFYDAGAQSQMSEGTLEMTLRDAGGSVLHTASQPVKLVPGVLSATSTSITLDRTYYDFTLETTLYDEAGAEVDTYVATYTCADLASGQCPDANTGGEESGLNLCKHTTYTYYLLD